MATITRETPLAEITIRRYEKPNCSGRELVRKLCLSLGLLQPGDSRDVIVDIVLCLLEAKIRQEELHSEEIKNCVMDYRKKNSLQMLGVAGSNIRRQLKRLKDMHLIESRSNLYRINEFASLSEIYQEKIEPFIIEMIQQRIKEYLFAIDQQFK